MAESKLGTAYVALRATLDTLEADLTAAKEKIESSLTAGMMAAGKSMAKLGGQLTAVLAPVSALGGLALDAGAQFDSALDTIRVGTGATGAALERLGADARAVFTSVPTSMALAAQAIADLNTRTGQTGTGLQELARVELELARLTGSELAPLIQQTTRLFGDWGVTMAQQTPTLDLLFRASQATGIGIETLAARLVQFGAPLRQMGFDLATSAALLGKFEQEGVNTELVLGSLRIALGKMAEAGVKDTAQGLREIIRSIQEAGSVGEANALAIKAFGARAGPDMAAAIREGRLAVDELLATIRNGDETILGAAADTMDYAERFTLLRNRVQEAAIPLGTALFQAINSLLPLLERAANFVAGLIERFAALPAPVQNGIVLFGGLLAAIGPVTTAFGGVITVLGAVGAALAPIALPVLAIVAALGLLAAAWVNDWGGIQEKTAMAWAFLQPILTAVVQWFQVNIPVALQFLSDLWNTVLLPAFQALANVVEMKIIPLLTALGEVTLAALGLASRALAGLWQNVVYPALEKVWKFIGEKLTPVLDALRTFIQSQIGPALQWFRDAVIAPLADAFGAIGAAIDRVIGWLNRLRDALNSVKLPDWLTPGSPTPLELGLRGIRRALREVANADVGWLAVSPGLAPVAGRGERGESWTFNIQVSAGGGAAAAAVAEATELGVWRALRAAGVR